MESYHPVEMISSDELSTTYKARNREGVEFMLESFSFESDIALDVMQGVFAEAALSLKFKHPCFPSLHDVFVNDRMQASVCYEYGSNCVPLPELMNRWSTTGMPVTHVKRLIYQLVKAVQHLHANKLVHQNICPQVITLQGDGLLKLRGLSSSALQSKIRGGSMRLPPNLKYAPPEVLVGDVSGAPMDVWAIGCICCELLTGQPLFSAKGEPGQIRTIASNVGLSTRQLSMIQDRPDHSKILFGISHHGFDTHFSQRSDIVKLREKIGGSTTDLIEFFKLCFEPDPLKRKTIDDLSESRFLKDAAKECRTQLADAEEFIRVRGADRARTARLSAAFVKLTEDLTSCGCDVSAAAASIGMGAPNAPGGARRVTPTPLGQERRYRGSGFVPEYQANPYGNARNPQAGASRALNRYGSLENSRMGGGGPGLGGGFGAPPQFASGGSFGGAGPSPWAGAYEAAIPSGNPSALSKTGAELLAGPPPAVPWAKTGQSQGRQGPGARTIQTFNSMGPPRELNERSSFVRRFVPEDRLGEMGGEGVHSPMMGRVATPQQQQQYPQHQQGYPLVNEFGDELDAEELRMQEESKMKSKAFVSGWLNQAETPASHRAVSRGRDGVNLRSSTPSDWTPQRMNFVNPEGSNNLNQSMNQSFNPNQSMNQSFNLNLSMGSNGGQGGMSHSRTGSCAPPPAALPSPQWAQSGPVLMGAQKNSSIPDSDPMRSSVGSNNTAVLLGSFNAFASRPSALTQEPPGLPPRVPRASNDSGDQFQSLKVPRASNDSGDQFQAPMSTGLRPSPLSKPHDALPPGSASDSARFKLNLAPATFRSSDERIPSQNQTERQDEPPMEPAKTQRTAAIPWLQQSHASATITMTPPEPLHIKYDTPQPSEHEATRSEKVEADAKQEQEAHHQQSLRPLSAIYEQELEGASRGPTRPVTAKPPMDPEPEDEDEEPGDSAVGAELPLDPDQGPHASHFSESIIRAPSAHTLHLIEDKEDYGSYEAPAEVRPPSARQPVHVEEFRPPSAKAPAVDEVRPRSGYVHAPILADEESGYQSSAISYSEEPHYEDQAASLMQTSDVDEDRGEDEDPVVRTPDRLKQASADRSKTLSPQTSRKSPQSGKKASPKPSPSASKSPVNPYAATSKPPVPRMSRLSSSGGGALQATNARSPSDSGSLAKKPSVKSQVSEVNGGHSIHGSPLTDSPKSSPKNSTKLPSLLSAKAVLKKA